MIHVYTGCGKGKTTAALGLVLRASGAGKKIFIGQFLKGRNCSEIKALKKIPNVTLEQFGSGCFIKSEVKAIDFKLAQKGFERIKGIITKGNYDVIILDEVNVALNLKIINLADLLKMLKGVSSGVEVILTGRDAPLKLVDMADLVSEIREVKHYYRKGIKARKGIEC